MRWGYNYNGYANKSSYHSCRSGGSSPHTVGCYSWPHPSFKTIEGRGKMPGEHCGLIKVQIKVEPVAKMASAGINAKSA